jgi:hypothetical protein
MALLDGQITSSPLGGIVNDRLSPALNQLAVDYWPGHDAIVSPLERGSVQSALPVSASSRTIAASITRAFSDDFYHRIHIRPPTLALGNVVSTQVETIEVWNAYMMPVTLVDIDGIEEGISLDGPDVFPLHFGGLQLRTWDVSVDEDGPSMISVTLTWNFSAVPDAQLRITGTRVVAWTIVPDWSRGIRERLQWHTDVLVSDERDEQRRALLLSPRRTFEAEMIVEGRERTFYDMLMRGWGGRIWALPIWPDVQLLGSSVSAGATSIPCSTQGRDFAVGRLVLLRGESPFVSETAEISAITSNSLQLARPLQRAWPVGTRVYPARTAMFAEQPRDKRLSDQACTIDARFVLMEANDWPAASLPTYRGHAVFDARPDESDELTGTYERMLSMLDVGSGIPYVLDVADAPFRVQGHAWKLNGVTERANFRSLLYALRGRQTPVWIPTHADDLHIVQSIGSASTTLVIEYVGYARFGFGQLGAKDIRIELRSGTTFYRRITDAVEIDEDTEQLSIDSALGQTVAPSDVFRISFMMLARLQRDEVEITHVTDVEGVATSSLLFVATRDA